MSQLSGFEVMAYNDCFFFRSPEGHAMMTDTQIGLSVVGPIAFVISGVIGFLILSNKDNQKYPFKIVGLICLVQSISIFALNDMYDVYCDSWKHTLLKNTLVTPSSWLAEKLGFHLVNLSDLELGGIFYVSNTVLFIFCLNFELVLSVSLNLDALTTIKHPFSRIQNLNNLFKFMRVSIIVFLIICVQGVFTILAYSKTMNEQDKMTDPYKKDEMFV